LAGRQARQAGKPAGNQKLATSQWQTMSGNSNGLANDVQELLARIVFSRGQLFGAAVAMRIAQRAMARWSF
jgi:hypothetical protein